MLTSSSQDAVKAIMLLYVNQERPQTLARFKANGRDQKSLPRAKATALNKTRTNAPHLKACAFGKMHTATRQEMVLCNRTQKLNRGSGSLDLSPYLTRCQKKKMSHRTVSAKDAKTSIRDKEAIHAFNCPRKKEQVVLRDHK